MVHNRSRVSALSTHEQARQSADRVLLPRQRLLMLAVCKQTLHGMLDMATPRPTTHMRLICDGPDDEAKLPQRR
ncbi:MAG: hypothetical protein AAGB04_02820 [Pseudomonadota bacterium]